jgi:prevent-host-death family protein
MTHVVPVSEARDKLTELLDDAKDHDVVLLKHGRPVGVLLSVPRYEAIVEKAEELEDILTMQEPADYITFKRST